VLPAFNVRNFSDVAWNDTIPERRHMERDYEWMLSAESIARMTRIDSERDKSSF